MRFSKLLLTAAAAGLTAFAAIAQQPELSDEQPPAETKAEPSRGLSDLEETVNQLLEEEVDPISRPSDEPRVPDRLPPEPEASQPPPEPALEPEPSEPSSAEPPVEASEPGLRAPPPPSEPEPRPEPPPETPRPAAAVTTAATAPRTPPRLAPPLTRTELAALDRTAERGRLLIGIARAGLLATQDMLTRISDAEGAGIRGWIAQPEGNAMTVTFYADGEPGPKAVYRANVLGGRVVSREIFLGPDRPALTPLQARMAAARAATEGLDHRACTTQPFNVFVVPPASASTPIDVYQVSAPTQRGHYPLGGNYRTTIAPDGSVAESRGFTNSCLDIEAAAPTAGQPARPIGVTHLLDPTPTEIHVFLALWSGHPLLVATGEPSRIWQVTDRIAEVRQ